jgi:hypothetical protein
MSMSVWIRHSHRGLSMVFTSTVAANFLFRAAAGEPPLWLTYCPLPPLALLLFSGLYLFVHPHLSRWRTVGAD